MVSPQTKKTNSMITHWSWIKFHNILFIVLNVKYLLIYVYREKKYVIKSHQNMEQYAKLYFHINKGLNSKYKFCTFIPFQT